MKIVTDRVPETEEEKLEVARTIGLEAGYEAVAIQSITPLEEAIAEGDIILEGTIVDSE
jgi:ethanolamine utilization microcompartment shell protein EutS